MLKKLKSRIFRVNIVGLSALATCLHRPSCGRPAAGFVSALLGSEQWRGVAARLVTCLYGSLFSHGAADGATLKLHSTQTDTSNTAGVGLRTPWEVRVMFSCVYACFRCAKIRAIFFLFKISNIKGHSALVGEANWLTLARLCGTWS